MQYKCFTWCTDVGCADPSAKVAWHTGMLLLKKNLKYQLAENNPAKKIPSYPTMWFGPSLPENIKERK